MNHFTRPQEETLRKLAEAYFEVHFKPLEDNEPWMQMWNNSRKIYVESIITGMTDPTCWGQ